MPKRWTFTGLIRFDPRLDSGERGGGDNDEEMTTILLCMASYWR